MQSQQTTKGQMEQLLIIRYTNHRGEQAERRIIPERIWFGSTEWHQEPQWLLEAFDLDRKAVRCFAVKDISATGSYPGR